MTVYVPRVTIFSIDFLPNLCYNNACKGGVVMAQSTTVLAFRKRLRLRGFANISIIRHGDFYHVSFDDPLSGFRLEYGIKESRMQNCFKRRVR